MTALQRLQLEQSEIREQLAGLLAAESLSDEQRTQMETLTARAQQIEPETRAALIAEAEPQPDRRRAGRCRDARTAGAAVAGRLRSLPGGRLLGARAVRRRARVLSIVRRERASRSTCSSRIGRCGARSASTRPRHRRLPWA